MTYFVHYFLSTEEANIIRLLLGYFYNSKCCRQLKHEDSLSSIIDSQLTKLNLFELIQTFGGIKK